MNISQVSSAGQRIGEASPPLSKSTPSAPVEAPATVAITPQPAAVDPAVLKQAVQAINDYLKPVVANGIEFSVDETSGKSLVQVIDLESKEVLMQFPSKEALTFGKVLDKMQGILISDKA